MKTNSNFWRLNEQIPGATLRVLDSQGKQIGILSKAEALKQAKDQNLDLIEIVPNANPPVAKIIEFSKFKYQEEKKKKEAQKRSKPSELKEIRFSPFIGEGDYQTRLKRVKEFLTGKDKVKLVVAFKGRQMGSTKFGYDLFNRVLKDLGEGVNIDMKPKFLGKHLMMIISPTAKMEFLKKSEKKEDIRIEE